MENQDNVYSALRNIEYSFVSRNCLIPGEDDFGAILVRKACDNVRKRLDEVSGYAGGLNLTALSNLFSEKLTRIQELEAQNIGRLQELCKEASLAVFDCPGSTVTVECHLGTSVDVDGPSPLAQPVNYADSVDDEVLLMIHDREIMDCLSYGMAHGVYEKFDELMDMVAEVEPELPGLYKDLVILYDALHLVDIEDFRKIEEKDIRLMSFSKLVFHGNESQPTIDSYAVCFPLLVIETLKGFCDLFTSHGLPDDTEQAEEVLKATDCLEKEQWYHLLGPVMWRLVFKDIQDADTSELPYFLMDLATMTPADLKDFLAQVLIGTPNAEGMANALFAHARREKEYDEFKDDIDRRNAEFEPGQTI